MDKQQAQDIVKDALQNPFDRERFVYFIKNLLNKIDESKAFHARGYVPEIFKDHVKTYERIGTYTDPEGKKTDILVVYLQKEAALDRARTTQRNFIARYLKDRNEKDAGLIAFVSTDGEDWRFSFVKMEYRLAETPTGRIKGEEEFTPARRYSYLVGKNENSHTAQSCLVPILEDDKNNPTLARLEEAFKIERVTEEFFEKYRDLFMTTKEALDEITKKDEKVRNNFQQQGIDTVDFAKKLLGQIVFLYFLQKKGWFGVSRDAKWGTGPKNFLRRLFEKRLSDYSNFFNDILEPLFYEALAIERQADFYSRFNCKIPFLNGGLFDPINNYDWVHTDVLLPDELFSNDIKTKEGDIGTGILDVFDRYNFTVKEDEPLEKEVAVDPEMLGKVFENLLEVKDRKSKGTYYTPREIVHYMCQESLINYLDNVINTSKEVIVAQKAVQKKLIGEDDPEQLGIMEQKQKTIIPKEDIESFIRHGISAIEHDRRVEAKGYETETYSYRMPDSIRLNAKLFDNALKAAKICDPAVGSGAFLVGMMHEIIRARETLTTYLGESEKRTPYNFKHHAIQDCLYGVDIDHGAVEIAKLRLWLSLMVDEEDIKHIKPLPNLDYKIVCGNSLLGINELFHHAQLKKLEELKGRFFEETNSKKKSQLKEDIDHLISEITHDDKHFDFKIYFSEVFNPSQSPLGKGGSQGGGFDIVIANPPYVRHETIKEMKPELKNEFGDFFCGTADIYTYFYKKGLDVLKPNGHLCFIAPNKFMRAGYGKNMRTLFTTEATLNIVIDFCDLPIFDATTYPSIILLEKRLPLSQDKVLAATFTETAQLERVEETLSLIGFPMPITSLKNEGWNLERPDVMALMEKLRKAGKPLGEYVHGRFYRGILTGLNEAFVIDEETRKKLIAEDPKSEELIKPWLRGQDIKKWKAEWAGLYVIFTRHGTEINNYPVIKHYLQGFKKDLEPKKTISQKHGRKPGTYKWYEIQDNIAYYKEFELPKITWGNLATEPKFAFDTSSHFISAPANIIPTDDLFLLAVLNSPLCKWWISLQAAVRAGGFLEYKPIYVGTIPVFTASDKQKAPIIERVEKILTAKKKDSNADTSALKKQIDKMVYELYGLTDEEIAIVEGKK